MKSYSLTDRLRYRFDNFMSRGTIALVAALFAATVCLILTAAAILFFAGLKPEADAARLGIAEAIWQVTMRTIDTGTVAGDMTWSFRAVGFLVTLGGIFIISALIGVLASGLEQRLNELRRGRSRVLESGHTIILGWSPQILTIINELAFANRNLTKGHRPNRMNSRNQPSACVAVLADRDKIEMEEEIRTKIPQTYGTRVVCRSGNPLDPDDLKIVSPDSARAIIVLSPGGQYPDLPVAKSLLALTQNRKERGIDYHIVAAVQRPANLEIFRIIGGKEAQVFLVDRLIAFIIAQTCRQPGLSSVYSELFSFDGAAIYFGEVQTLAATRYGDALYRFENSSLIGLRHPDGKYQLNPPMDTIIQANDQLITIAGDDDAIQLSHKINFEIEPARIRNDQSSPHPLEKLLILGWNRRAPLILDQLRHYMTPGSKIKVFAPFSVEQMLAECGETSYKPVEVTFEQGNPMDRSGLEKLVESGYPFIVILSPTDSEDIQIADAATMVALIHIRDIAQKSGMKFSMVTEIMDVRNRELTEVTSEDDVIISERLIALALTQIAENPQIAPVFIDLLTPSDTEIYLKPISDYIVMDGPVNFYTVVAAAQQRGETAIGYRLIAEAGQVEESFGVHVNPAKSAQISFTERDQVIVIAESG